MNTLLLQDAHTNAFNVAAVMPVPCQQELSCLIGQLLEKGASFDEAKIALQHLNWSL